LRRFGCILDAPTRRRRPLELAEPMTNIELDFTDVSSVPSEPLGKKQHGVESFNAIDAGTSTWLFTQVRTDFTAQTALLAVIEVFSQYGCPKQVTFDRDPRWIGAQQMRTFPSAFVRMLLCLGITPRICPPRRPYKKPFVERLHRTLQEECLLLQHPQTPEAAQEVSEQFRQHYNQERPHQGKACGNVPPQTAFPILPTLPPLPARIDPDRWLSRVQGRAYARKVNKDGRVIIDDEYYYIKQSLAGQKVVLTVNAEEQVFEVRWKNSIIRRLPKRRAGRP